LRIAEAVKRKNLRRHFSTHEREGPTLPEARGDVADLPTDRYGQPEPDEPEYEVDDEAQLKLREAAPIEGARFEYVYDLGDSWTHEVSVEGIEPPDPEFHSPECLAGERACPPEDCGGLLKDKPGATARQKVISEIMSGVERTRIDTEKNFLDVLDRVHDLSNQNMDPTHVFPLSQVYEGLLLKMGEKGNDGGQFFTPREIIRAMVRIVDPKVGETVYDPGCGDPDESAFRRQGRQGSSDPLRLQDGGDAGAVPPARDRQPEAGRAVRHRAR
jgi:hypothetical protein